jgi:site-specific DNA recombinase
VADRSRAAIYCRVSTEEQTKNLSLQTQLQSCCDYCEQRDIEIARVFTEEGASAKTADARPQFTELLSYCTARTNNIDVVLVHRFDRFARNAADHLSAKVQLKLAGVKIRSVSEATDDSAAGELAEVIFAGMAQFDNRVRAERTIAGMKATLENGRWTHGAPLGYTNAAKDSGGPSLLPDPSRSSFVTLAFELYASGDYSKAEIAGRLAAQGLRTRGGEEPTYDTINRMLRNPLYAGRVVSPSWSIDRPGDFRPLVTDEMFRRTQARLNGCNRGCRKSPSPKGDFPLKRVVRCAACGGPLTGAWTKGKTKRYAYYWCWNPKCRAVKSTAASNLHSLFADLLHSMSLEPKMAALFRAIVTDLWSQSRDRGEAASRQLRRRLDQIQSQRDRLTETFAVNRDIKKQAYDSLDARLAQGIQRIEFELEEKTDDWDVRPALEFAEGVMSAPDEFWKAAPPGVKVRFQQVYFPEGVRFDGRELRTPVTPPFVQALGATAVRELSFGVPNGIRTRIGMWAGQGRYGIRR